MKDFVFIDDRPDELDRMRNAFPEILAFDATHPATWNILGAGISVYLQIPRKIALSYIMND